MGLSWRGLTYLDRSADEGISLSGTWSWNATRIQRVYQVVLTDYAANGDYSHQNVVRFLMGWPEIKAGRLCRNLPHSLNFLNTDTARPYMFATKVDTQGLAPSTQGLSGGPTAYPVYKELRCKVDYETLPFDVLEDAEVQVAGVVEEYTWKRYVTKIVRPAGQFFTVNAGPAGTGYSYVGGGGVVRIGISKLLGFCNLQVTWHQIPERAVPSLFANPLLSAPGAIESCIGKVNHETFNGYTKGTLLLLGAEMRPYRSPFGQRVFDITYMFKYFEPESGEGHQYLFRPATPGWIEVTTDGNTNLTNQTDAMSIYDWAKSTNKTFKDLFRPPP